MSKLQEDDVRFIKEALSQGHRRRMLAEQFGVSRSTIHLIAQGKIWQHV